MYNIYILLIYLTIIYIIVKDRYVNKPSVLVKIRICINTVVTAQAL